MKTLLSKYLSSNRILFIAAISFYLLWWANAIHLLYWKEYNNHAAGGYVLIFTAQTPFLLFVFTYWLVLRIGRYGFRRSIATIRTIFDKHKWLLLEMDETVSSYFQQPVK